MLILHRLSLLLISLLVFLSLPVLASPSSDHSYIALTSNKAVMADNFAEHIVRADIQSAAGVSESGVQVDFTITDKSGLLLSNLQCVTVAGTCDVAFSSPDAGVVNITAQAEGIEIRGAQGEASIDASFGQGVVIVGGRQQDWFIIPEVESIVDPEVSVTVSESNPITFDGATVVLSVVKSFNTEVDGVYPDAIPGQLTSGETLGLDLMALEANHSSLRQKINTSEYDTARGILNISLVDKVANPLTAAELQLIFRHITYKADAAAADGAILDGETRFINFVAGEETYYSIYNGHYYRFINEGAPVRWTEAMLSSRSASNKLYGAFQGYLLTVTSANENSFIFEKAVGNTWLGLKDSCTGVNDYSFWGDIFGTSGKCISWINGNRQWYWVTGPETGVLDTYLNWSSGEPNDTWHGREDHDIGVDIGDAAHEPYGDRRGEPYGHILKPGEGKWNDFSNTDGSIQSYIIEFGGYAEEGLSSLHTERIIQVTSISLESTGSELSAEKPEVAITQTATVILQMNNDEGSPIQVSDILVDYEITNTLGAVVVARGQQALKTDANGQLVISFTTLVAGSYTVNAWLDKANVGVIDYQPNGDTVNNGAPLTLTFNPIDYSNSGTEISGSDLDIYAGSIDTETITAQLRDKNSNPIAISGVEVALQLDGVASFENGLQSISGVTDSNGQFIAQLSSFAVERVNVVGQVNIDGTMQAITNDGDDMPVADGNDAVEVNFIIGLATDSDLDGVPDFVELAELTDPYNIADYVNTDKVSEEVSALTPDFLDDDADNDGILNIKEYLIDIDPYSDADQDGTPNYLDKDNNGIAAQAESNCTDVEPDNICDLGSPLDPRFDQDQDGKPNHADSDSDDDGINDNVEYNAALNANNDPDNDGVPNHLDTDSDGDDISDRDEGARHFDDDGVPNFLDTDSDGDGLLDKDETSGDVDEDNTPNYLDKDSDNDGISDEKERLQAIDVALLLNNGTSVDDTDRDFILNVYDQDSDNDGIPDFIESGLSNVSFEPVDTDEDGMPNYLDIDSDNDGVPDVLEATNSIDSDDDGIYDEYDVDLNDPDVSAVRTDVSAVDTDGDGIADFQDIDADNDGIADGVEAGIVVREDDDGDGIDNVFDLDSGGIAIPTQDNDKNLDSVMDTLRDTDADGIPDFRDLDSDNDSINDVNESGLTDDDNDGLVDGGGLISDYSELPNTIQAGSPNYINLQSNGASFDIAASVDAEQDNNADGLVDETADTDSDGIADSVDNNVDEFGEAEPAPAPPAKPSDDADGDGISNIDEGFNSEDPDASADADNDGIANYLDTDSDGDGILDADEGRGVHATYTGKPADSDGDGAPDFLDLDSDNDGYSDRVENRDHNNDGISDHLQKPEGVSTQVSGHGANSGSIQWLGLFGLLLLLVHRKKKSLAIISACIALFSLNTQAAESVCHPDSKTHFIDCWYVGAGVGVSFLEPEGGDWEVSDTNDTSIKLQVGYQFLPNFFAEMAYHDLGAASLKYEAPGVSDTGEVAYESFALWAGYSIWDNASTWNIYGKLGLAAINNSSNHSNLSVEEETSVQAALAAGVQWQFSQHWFTRLELESFDKDAKAVNVNINYIFGKKKAPVLIAKVDSDSDGVYDESDSCPHTFLGAQIDSKGCELDGDSDFVVNHLDQCPETLLGAKVDETGCNVMVKESITFNLHVSFEPRKTTLTEDSKTEIVKLANLLKEHSTVTIEIGGHTDSVGDEAYNQALSEERAQVVRDEVLSLLDATDNGEKRMSAVGYGELSPIADNNTEEGKAKNRRVEVKIDTVVERTSK